MKEIYLLTIGLLIFICVILLTLFLGKIRQNKHFAEELQNLRDNQFISPLKVDSFSRDSVELVCEINKLLEAKKHLEEEYIRSEENLKRMIAGVSHDFRTPLTAILGYLQLLQHSGSLSQEDKENLNTALERCHYLVQLSEDFFELSKLQAEENKRISGRVNLSEILIQCCMAQYDQMKKQGFEFLPDIPEKPMFASGDAHVLERVIQNMISNACRYANESISVSLMEAGDYLLVHFENDYADTELTEGECPQVFEPFYRGSVRHGGGSGLGLFTVKSLTERMGGSVKAWVSSGHFHIEIKLMKAD